MKIKSVGKSRRMSSPIPPAKRYYVLLKGSKQGHLIDAYSGYDEGKIRIVKKKKGRVKAETVAKNVESKPKSEEPKSFRSQRASSPTQSAEISLKEYVATEALPVVKEAVTEVKKEVEEKVREREERESKRKEEKEKEEKVKSVGNQRASSPIKEKKDKEEYEARQDALEEYLDEN